MFMEVIYTSCILYIMDFVSHAITQVSLFNSLARTLISKYVFIHGEHRGHDGRCPLPPPLDDPTLILL